MAERIVQLAEREQQYRIETTKREEDQKDRLIEIAGDESKQYIKAQNRGQIIGATIAVLCVIAGFASLFIINDWRITLGFLAIPSAALVLSFMPKRREVTSRREEKKEDVKK